MSGRPMARRRRPAGMTLVELMVATALGVMLISIITFIWLQSNRIFSTTVQRLETYQRMRSVLDTMERDLANTDRTVDMEFYEDELLGPPPTPPAGNGHYDSGDTLFDFRTPRDEHDPLAPNPTLGIAGQPEFGIPEFPGDQPYVFAPTILSAPPYKIGAGYTDNRFYWRDEVYVRSFATINGLNRPALIHYRLVPTADGRSALRRRVWWLNDEGEFIAAGNPDPTERTAILSNGVAELKIGFYFKETPAEADGRWFHVGDRDGTFEDAEGLGRGEALLAADQDRGFNDARTLISPKLQDQFTAGAKSLNAISFVYEGVARFEQTEFGPVVLRTLADVPAGTSLDTRPLQVAGDLAHYTSFDFPGVRSGDRLLVYEATDDDANYTTPAPEAGNLFPDRLLTVDTIFVVRDPLDMNKEFAAVKFREPIDFSRLKAEWLGAEPPFQVLPSHLGAHPKAGPAPDVTPTGNDGPEDGRTIIGSFNVRYRVGFLPAAFIVRLSCDDTYNRKILPMERVIRLVQQ